MRYDTQNDPFLLRVPGTNADHQRGAPVASCQPQQYAPSGASSAQLLIQMIQQGSGCALR